ncbi:MAG: hypothetical protein ACQESJ_07980 [Bacteroidota bacterium]
MNKKVVDTINPQYLDGNKVWSLLKPALKLYPNNGDLSLIQMNMSANLLIKPILFVFVLYVQ